MDKTYLMKHFHDTLLKFIDELINVAPNEMDLITLRLFFSSQIPYEDIIKNFIVSVLPHRTAIKNREEKYFLEEQSIFSKLNNEKVFHFKNIWKKMDSDDKKVVWEYFDVFILFSDKYLQLQEKGN